ncbi:hypothetical protein C8R31_10375 [Nitrosospira sp. Nsp2]|uniref:hypothetical protein n=1 Tax=Nitrosospira sp. Nsp2 TaxID=136548 RepID=UPI000D2FEFE6|nr:hypothetical protein [Nitrosospira sp. Nsp2]PTR15492.1 hypothetical protein C8R31_10375 [Nitrosospira sp. Nsp2]
MGLSFLQNAWLRMRWQAERLGTPGKIGFALFVFSAAFFFAAVLPRRAESSALMIKAETMQAQLKAEPARTSTSGSGIRKAVQGHEGLQVFYEFFPSFDSTPFWINEVVQSAAEHAVEISGTEYRLVREKEVKLARYEMLVPVRGKYSQVRGFIAGALRAVPPMALVDVAIKREGVDSELLDANLKFNLYLSEGPE